jgi:polyisoprenoid-binding protein YceI
MAKWIIDPDHSVAGFAVRHLTIANVRGQFNKVTGTIQYEPDDLPHSSVDVVIETSTITTGIKKRDEHLLSPDFLDASKYPEIQFKSTKAESSGRNRIKVAGDLTIHGITRPVNMEMEYSGPVKSPFGGEITMGFSARTKVNRDDFGITWNEIMEDGGVMVGREVEITIDVEADRVNE